jgi:hypothetical protein
MLQLIEGVSRLGWGGGATGVVYLEATTPT